MMRLILQHLSQNQNRHVMSIIESNLARDHKLRSMRSKSENTLETILLFSENNQNNNPALVHIYVELHKSRNIG